MNISISMQNLQTKPRRIPYELKKELFVRLEFQFFSPKIKRNTSITQRKKLTNRLTLFTFNIYAV